MFQYCDEMLHDKYQDEFHLIAELIIDKYRRFQFLVVHMLLSVIKCDCYS